MPILAVDQLGRIYVTSPDRSDGLGYGGSPEVVSQGDVTLGAAHMNAQSQRSRDAIQARRNQQIIDAEDREAERQARLQAKQEEIREEEYLRMMSNPHVQQAALRQAMNGCECTHATSLSGFGLSANGQRGVRGMTRDEQAIYHAATGKGRDTSFGVDPVEREQAQMRAEANRILRAGARR